MFIRGNINEEIKNIIPILCVTDRYIIINKTIKRSNIEKIILFSNIEKIQVKEFNNKFLIKIKLKDEKSKHITLTNKNFERENYYDILKLFRDLKLKLSKIE
ncbi:MAG: hypothetical protein ABF289_06255 [Clostridiales bacterium]